MNETENQSILNRSKTQLESELAPNSLMYLEHQNSMLKRRSSEKAYQLHNFYNYAQNDYNHKLDQIQESQREIANFHMNGTNQFEENQNNQYQNNLMQPSICIDQQTNKQNLLNRDPPSHSKILDFSEAYYAQRQSDHKIFVQNDETYQLQSESKLQEDNEMSIVLKNKFNQTIEQTANKLGKKDNQSMFAENQVFQKNEYDCLMKHQSKQNITMNNQIDLKLRDLAHPKDEYSDSLNPMNLNIQEESSFLLENKIIDENQSLSRKNYYFLTRNKQYDASIKRTKTHNFQQSSNLIQEDCSYEYNENQEDSAKIYRIIPRDSSVIFEQDESILLSNSKMTQNKNEKKRNNSIKSRNNFIHNSYIDDEQRKKIQQEWRKNTIRHRKSQILQGSGSFNQSMLKSNLYLNQNSKFHTSNQEGIMKYNQKLNSQEGNKFKLQIGRSLYNQRDRTNSYVLLYQQNNFLTQSYLLPRSESGNIQKTSQQEKDNYWKEKVQLLIDDKKRWMKETKELRQKISDLTLKNEILEKKLKNLSNVINRFDSVQFEFPAPNYYGISPEKNKKDKIELQDITNMETKLVADQTNSDSFENLGQQNKNLLENQDDENVKSGSQIPAVPLQQISQISNFNSLQKKNNYLQDENNIFNRTSANDNEIFSQSHLMNITQTNVTSYQYQQSIPQPQASQLRMKNKFQHYSNAQILRKDNNFQILEGYDEDDEVITPMLGRPNGQNLGEKTTINKNYVIKIMKQPLNFLQRADGDKSLIGEEIEESRMMTANQNRSQISKIDQTKEKEMRLTENLMMGNIDQGRSGNAVYQKYNQNIQIRTSNFMNQPQPIEASGDQRPSADSNITNTSFLVLVNSEQQNSFQKQNQSTSQVSETGKSEKSKKKNGVGKILSFIQKKLGGSQQKKEKLNNLSQSQENTSESKIMFLKKRSNNGNTIKVAQIQNQNLQLNIEKILDNQKQRESQLSARSHSVDKSGSKIQNKNNFYDQFEDYENLINQQDNLDLRIGKQNTVQINNQQIQNLNFEKLVVKDINQSQNINTNVQNEEVHQEAIIQNLRDTLEITDSICSSKKTQRKDENINQDQREQFQKQQNQRISNQKNIKSFTHRQNTYFENMQAFQQPQIIPNSNQKRSQLSQEQEYFVQNQQDSIVESSKFPNNYSNSQIQNISKGALIIDQRQTFNPNDPSNGFQIKKSSGVSIQNSIQYQPINQDNNHKDKINFFFKSLTPDKKIDQERNSDQTNDQQSFISAIHKDSSQIYFQNNNSAIHNNSLFTNSSQFGNLLLYGQSKLNSQQQNYQKNNNLPLKIATGNLIKGFPTKSEFAIQRQQHKEQLDRFKIIEQNSNVSKNSIDQQQQNNKINIKNQFMRLSANSNKFSNFTCQNNKNFSQNSSQNKFESEQRKLKLDQEMQNEMIKVGQEGENLIDHLNQQTTPASQFLPDNSISNSFLINDNLQHTKFNHFSSPIEAAMAFSNIKKQ